MKSDIKEYVQNNGPVSMDVLKNEFNCTDIDVIVTDMIDNDELGITIDWRVDA